MKRRSRALSLALLVPLLHACGADETLASAAAFGPPDAGQFPAPDASNVTLPVDLSAAPPLSPAALALLSHPGTSPEADGWYLDGRFGALNAREPTLLGADLIYADPDGLWREPADGDGPKSLLLDLADLTDAPPPGRLFPLSPLLQRGPDGAATRVVLPLLTATDCRLATVSLTTPAAPPELLTLPGTCQAPSLSRGGIVIPTDGPGGPKLSLAHTDGLSQTALDAAPTGPAIRLERRDIPGATNGGGSQWLELWAVPTGESISLVEIAEADLSLTVVGLTSLPGLTIRRAITTGAGHLVLTTLPTANPLPRSLGDQLTVLSVDWAPGSDAPVTVSPLSEALLPGQLTAEPVIRVADSAGGGSQWLEGVIVAGGDGWAAGYVLGTGVETFDQPLDWVVTGLAVTDQGWVMGGGSQWLPNPDQAGWTVALLGTDAKALLQGADGAGVGGVSAPLLGCDGEASLLLTARDGTTTRVHLQTGLGGPAGGTWSVSHGDSDNSGGPAGALCDNR